MPVQVGEGQNSACARVGGGRSLGEAPASGPGPNAPAAPRGGVTPENPNENRPYGNANPHPPRQTYSTRPTRSERPRREKNPGSFVSSFSIFAAGIPAHRPAFFQGAAEARGKVCGSGGCLVEVRSPAKTRCGDSHARARPQGVEGSRLRQVTGRFDVGGPAFFCPTPSLVQMTLWFPGPGAARVEQKGLKGGDCFPREARENFPRRREG